MEEETVAILGVPDVQYETLVGLVLTHARLIGIETLPHQMQVALHGRHVARSVLSLLMVQEVFETLIIVVVAVDAVCLAMNG